MNVFYKTKSTVEIVGAINTMLFSEYCYSYFCKNILALSGEKSNRNYTKSEIFCCGIVMHKNNNTLEVS